MPRRRSSRSFDFSLPPETQRGIAIVFLFALAIFLLLGMFRLAGTAGQTLDDGVAYVFGWDKIFVPFCFVAWGCYLLAPQRLPLRFVNVVGILLFFLTFNPFVHVISFPRGAVVNDLAIRVAGGKLGQLIAAPLVQYLGSVGSLIVWLALCLVALLLIFNATLAEVLFFLRWLAKAAAAVARAFWVPVQKGLASNQRRRAEAKILTTSIADIPQASPRDVVLMPVASPLPLPSSAKMSLSGQPQASVEADDDEAEEFEPPKPKKRYPRVEIPFDLLERRDQRPTSGDIAHNREVIRRTLETFGIAVEMAEVAVGPTVTQFTLKPAEGVKITKITALHNDLALALAAHPIRIEAPIPGKSLVGVEVPNQSVATVGIREILESREFRERKNSLSFVLGKDVSGKPWIAEIGKMPHLLVAGATGSGKSVCLNTLIMSLLYTNGPDDLKFIMVDPKRVELQIYNGIPHLMTPVITKVNETVNALKWALREMDYRYDVLAKLNVRDIGGYNQRVQDALPYLVIIIDELADLMATSAAEVEGPIVRLAQMARAVGIHLVLATQRPSVDVITGLIKANVPARIAFAVASATDSRTILDQQGADKLLGRGDMLFSSADMPTPKRIQGAFVSDMEIQRVVEYIKSKYEPADYNYAVVEKASGSTFTAAGMGMSDDDDDGDPLLDEAKEEILRAGKASASLLQRRLKVGYARAARLLDLLEQQGFIGPGDGAKPREILQADLRSSLPAPVGLPRSVPATAAAPETISMSDEDDGEPHEDDV